MGWYLDQEHVTQAAAFLVKRGGTDRMQYLKLLKLLYLADRESLRETGLPITGDAPIAMKMGPVLSEVYNYIKGDEFTDHAYWDRHFHKVSYEIVLDDDPGASKLSRYDTRILASAYDGHRDINGFEMSDVTHEFPEWEIANKRRELDGRGSEPIDIRDTMGAVGCSAECIASALATRDEERGYFRFFAGLSNVPDPSPR